MPENWVTCMGAAGVRLLLRVFFNDPAFGSDRGEVEGEADGGGKNKLEKIAGGKPEQTASGSTLNVECSPRQGITETFRPIQQRKTGGGERVGRLPSTDQR